MRCLLVLVLAFDFLSTPFHHHRHDGVDGPLAFTAAHSAFDDGNSSHVEDDDPALASHAALAIRVDASQLGRLPAMAHADAPPAAVSAIQCLAALDDPPPARWRPDRSRTDFRCHRSLPPAGRAPPPL